MRGEDTTDSQPCYLPPFCLILLTVLGIERWGDNSFFSSWDMLIYGPGYFPLAFQLDLILYPPPLSAHPRTSSCILLFSPPSPKTFTSFPSFSTPPSSPLQSFWSSAYLCNFFQPPADQPFIRLRELPSLLGSFSITSCALIGWLCVGTVELLSCKSAFGKLPVNNWIHFPDTRGSDINF